MQPEKIQSKSEEKEPYVIPTKRQKPPLQYRGSTITIGKLIFRSNIPTNIKDCLSKPNAIKYYSRKYFDFDGLRMQKFHCSEVLPYLPTAEYQHAIIKYHRHTQLIPALAFTSFPYLQSICLYDNKITSLESLAFVNAPELRSLQLSQNLITTLKALNKTQWNKLEALLLKEKYMTRIKFVRFVASPKFTKLIIDFYIAKGNILTDQDHDDAIIFLKLQTIAFLQIRQNNSSCQDPVAFLKVFN